MQVNKNSAAILRQAIATWRVDGVIDDGLAATLTGSIQAMPFDWRRLAKYSLWASLICIVTALGAVVADSFLLDLLDRILASSNSLKSATLALLSAGLYWTGLRIRRRHPERLLSSEAVLFLGVLATAGAIYELGLTLDNGSGHFSLLILLSCGLYAGLGLWFGSNLIWLFALLSLGGWLGAETGYASGWGAYYLGMNYPLRFTLFGGVLTAAALGLGALPRLAPFQRTTLVMGLLYLFISLWLLSIFGNYGDETSWHETRQIELFHWSILFAAAAIAAIVHGLRFDDARTKGFGLTFLFINLYTRYFELFWNQTHKAVFFALLAASFWLLGRKAETIWALGRKATLPVEPSEPPHANL